MENVWRAGLLRYAPSWDFESEAVLMRRDVYASLHGARFE